ncbi:MAG: hypothetical protein A3H17_00810 [Candidatus Levybacteria bacterium RIFCSPLOWO2_12_FULL_37_14]|nr:MAG: type 12 methyltransferase [Candidatus Levybacteria bacterium GW2011_GWA1_37_16]KKQ38567.1 MAG: type 12 methyltransferase [Candidatus Levybacteria bacterium GW2011_GWC2_37_7]KKQ42098.1 MAG: type 12 methyltransferase [Candidatus Levybacteria bacterium GW2011_GWB1_37_8]OGH50202.1 MAG: hypothetical protein A3H17_00810 [Candidatus Levybacteria bacterium RIFCSPLOWO2_12_FULL_37_14]
MVERSTTPEITSSLYATKKDAWIYDLIYETTEKEDIPFWLNLAKQLKPRNILEIGVGTGRIAIPLAKAGFEVVGLDLEESMLDVAREKTAKLPQETQNKLKFVRGDARYIDLGQTFDLVTISLNTFCHFLTKKDQMEALKNLKEHLDPQRGVLAIDMFNPLARPVQRWDSSKQGPISVDRPPIKIYQTVDTQRKLLISRKVRDYIDPAREEACALGKDILFVDREAEVIDWNSNPPTVFRNRATFPVSYHSVFSLWFGQVFREAGFENARFIGDYKGHRFIDAKMEDNLQTIKVDFHDPVSEKMIIIAGPGQGEVKIKDYSLKKAKAVKDPVLDITLDGTNIRISDPRDASYFLNCIIRFSKLSNEERNKALEEMNGILKETKTTKTEQILKIHN